MMKTSAGSFNKEVASYALGKLRAGEITAEQMKSALELRHDLDPVTAMIGRIRAGQSIAIGPEQVQCYNSMQAFFAHRFVIDPDDNFSVATEMIEERQAAAHRERDAG